LTVGDLIKELKKYDSNTPVGIKWMYPVNPLRWLGLVNLTQNGDVSPRGKAKWLLLSPWDVDIKAKY